MDEDSNLHEKCASLATEPVVFCKNKGHFVGRDYFTDYLQITDYFTEFPPSTFEGGNC